jgi:hypothetical protein
MRPVYNTLGSPCAYGNCAARGHCLRRRQCTLTTVQHTECESMFAQYAPIYHGLGYNNNYVKTYATTPHSTPMATVEHVDVHSPISTISTGSTFYAPKTTVGLSHDLQTKYANML